MLGYGDAVIDKPVKVHGIVKTGSIGTVDADQRFIVQDQESGQELRIMFQDALANEIADGSEVVLTGSLSANGSFAATVVALEA